MTKQITKLTAHLQDGSQIDVYRDAMTRIVVENVTEDCSIEFTDDEINELISNMLSIKEDRANFDVLSSALSIALALPAANWG